MATKTSEKKAPAKIVPPKGGSGTAPAKSATKKIAQAAVTGERIGFFGRRGFLFYRHFRREYAAALVREKGYDWFAAREAANDISEEEIDEKADKLKIGKLGDGRFIDWLIENGPKIMQLIQLFLAAFMMKGPKHFAKMMKKAEVAAKEDPFEDDDEEEEEE